MTDAMQFCLSGSLPRWASLHDAMLSQWLPAAVGFAAGAAVACLAMEASRRVEGGGESSTDLKKRRNDVFRGGEGVDSLFMCMFVFVCVCLFVCGSNAGYARDMIFMF